MAAEKLLFPRRWYGGMISTDLEVIWEIPAKREFFMKARFFGAMISSAALLSVATSEAAKPRCDNFQLVSCVGDEVQSCSATTPYGERYAVSAADVANSRSSGNAQLCFAVLSSTLCPDTDAIATIAKNGRVIYSGSVFDINGFLRVNAKEAELIDISVILQPIPDPPNTICVRLGDTFFGLGRIQ